MLLRRTHGPEATRAANGKLGTVGISETAHCKSTQPALRPKGPLRCAEVPNDGVGGTETPTAKLQYMQVLEVLSTPGMDYNQP